MEILTVKNLKFSYPLSSKATLDGIDFSVKKGEFILLCGAVGGGKSTLLKTLIPEIRPVGEISGDIHINDGLRIGYICQNPEEQIVTDKVYHEIAFALENLGYDNTFIKRRTAEVSSYFGLDSVLFEDCSSLSGGQKQILNLASAMAQSPDVLILDEPTSRLDPVSCEKFFSVLAKLKNDLDCTVIIAEHNISELLAVCDRICIMDGGKMIFDGEQNDALPILAKYKPLQNALPAPLRIYGAFDIDTAPPLTMKEGRKFLNEYFIPSDEDEETPEFKYTSKALEAENIYFRYSKRGKDVLFDFSLDVYEGEILFLLGANASGKSTALSVLSGILKPYCGKIKVFGKKIKEYGASLYKTLTYLPQEPRCLFTHDTVKKELDEVNFQKDSFPYDFTPILDSHPYDISGGQAQLLALAKAVSGTRRIVLLDEPTSSLDHYMISQVTEVIKSLNGHGITFVIVSHDLDFAAECADRCTLMFAGSPCAPEHPRKFFSGSSFYSTKINTLLRSHYKNAVTFDDAVKLMEENRRAKI